MRKLIGILLVVGLSLMGLGVLAQEGSGPVNIAFIFDASGSMMAAMEGRTRLAVAQDAMAGLVAGIAPGTNTSLWVYGHRLSQDDPAASCQDIENVIPLGPLDAGQFEATVRQIHAIGYTPITDSIQLAAQTLLDQPNARNTVVLVSDGEETCGGSPCLMAQALKQANIALTINTIGFAPNDLTREQLECIADVTGGTYYEAEDSQQLNEALQAAVVAPGTVQVVDAEGSVQWEIGFTLQPADGSGTAIDYLGTATVPAGDYTAHVNSDPPVDTTVSVASEETASIVVALPEVTGLMMVNLAGEPLPEMSFSASAPDSAAPLYGTGMLEVAPGDYHVAVNTAFAQAFDVTVPDGVTVPIAVNDEEGLIRIVNLAGDPLPEMYFNVTDPASGEVHYGQGAMRVPSGDFPVEVDTAFSTFVEVTVADDQTVDVAVNDAQGVIRIVNLAGELLPDMPFNVVDPVSGETVYGQGAMDVPPGAYPVEVDTAFATYAEVTVADDETVDVAVDDSFGTIVLTDVFGEPLPEVNFHITDPATGEPIYAQGQIDLPPGTYALSVSVDPPVEIEVTLADGQRLEVPVNNETGTIRLVDPDGNPIPGLSFNVIDPSAGVDVYAVGTAEMATGEYTVRVNLAFPFETTVSVQPGEITDVAVDNAVGTVRTVNEDGDPLEELVFAITNTETGAATTVIGTVDVPPGSYSVEVFTDVPFSVDLEVAAGAVTDIVVGAVGTLRVVDEDGEVVPDMLFTATPEDGGDGASALGSVELPPGAYSVEVFTIFPFTTDVDVVPEETTDILIEATGAIQVVNARGRVQEAVLFTVERLEDGASTSELGEVDVPPGLYRVTVRDTKTFEVEVEVLAGEATTVNVANGTTNHPAP